MNLPLTPPPDDAEPDLHLGEDTCLDLLHGLLPPGESENALAHAVRCPACAELLRARIVTQERLRATWRLRTMPNGEFELERAEPVGERATGRELAISRWHTLLDGLRRRRLQLAGGLAATAAALWVVLSPPALQLVEGPQLHVIQSFVSTEIRGPVQDSVDFHAGLDAYDNQDYRRAAELLGRAEMSGAFEFARKIYLGNALAWSGRDSEAVSTLQAVPTEILPEPWSSEARWTLFVAMLRSGSAPRADSLLAVMAAEPTVAGDRARDWRRQRERR